MLKKTFPVLFITLLLLVASSMSIAENKSSFNALGDLFSGDSTSDQLLEPDDAFSFSASTNKSGEITLNWQVADGYYLYKEKVKVTPVEPKNLQLQALVFPKGKEKKDEIFGDTIVYYGELILTQKLTTPSAVTSNVTLEVEFQGCADIGVCYPPMKKTVTLALTPNVAISATPKIADISEQDEIANSLVNNNIFLVCLTFLGFGILLSFTPCVFPMIPILSGIIIGHGEDLTTRKAFHLSLSYVLASALTYALFGILAGLFGSNLQATFQNPWILSFFSALFVLLSLSMFGLYQIQLPSAIQSKLSNLSQHQKHGSLWGSAVMGFLSTLIVGPCVAAPLAGVLIYIGQTGDAILGGFALFSLGIGMGIPLIIVGISAGKLLPKAGSWMDPIKYFFGVMLLAVAIWIMERILPAAVSLILWAVLLIICAIYLKAIDALKEDASGWHKLSKGLGIVFLSYGIILMIGAASGGTSMFKPLSNFSLSQQQASAQHGLAFQRVKTLDELHAALETAQQNKQFVMFDFYADWCVSCKEMEAFTFTDPAVQRALKNTVLLQADVTENNADDRKLLNAFNLIGPPAILFFDLNSQEVKSNRVIGYMQAEDFLKQVQKLKQL